MALFVGASPIEYVLARVLKPGVLFILTRRLHPRDRLYQSPSLHSLARNAAAYQFLGAMSAMVK